MVDVAFSYPANDEDTYLSWYADDFASVFVSTNPILKVSGFTRNEETDWIPKELHLAARQEGVDAAVTWKEVEQNCGFSSIAHINRALRLTGSKRISGELSCPSDTAKLLEVCGEHKLFVPDEGALSPVVHLGLARFLTKLGQNKVIVADHFGTSPRIMKVDDFLLTGVSVPPEIQTLDRSVYISAYTDYHYFLVCQSEGSTKLASPSDYFEGLFAEKFTNDYWGVGDLGEKLDRI